MNAKSKPRSKHRGYHWERERRRIRRAVRHAKPIDMTRRRAMQLALAHRLDSTYWMLNADGVLVCTRDVLEWARWFETADRVIARDTVGPLEISTVFLGINHSFIGGVPVLWETMIFCAPLGSEQSIGDEVFGFQDRYTSTLEALEGHARAVAFARARVQETAVRS